MLHKVDELNSYPKTNIDGIWCIARPMNDSSIKKRIKSVWLVLIGKADVVIFYKQ